VGRHQIQPWGEQRGAALTQLVPLCVARHSAPFTSAGEQVALERLRRAGVMGPSCLDDYLASELYADQEVKEARCRGVHL
jgi:hypothetical protein